MQSTTSSTRTFQTSSANAEKPKPPKQPKTPKLKSTKRLITRKNAPWIAIIVLILVCGFLFLQYRSAQNKLSGGTKETHELVVKISKIAVVPTNETPTVATVKDVNKLKSQAFFTSAKNGDKLLVFPKEKLAVLYRPSTNQIVTILPQVNLNGSTSVTGQ